MKKILAVTTQTTGNISVATTGASISMGRTELLSAQVTVTGTGSGTVQWQVSNDGVNWADYGSSVAISGAGTVWAEMSVVTGLYARLSYGVTSAYSATSTIVQKGMAL